MISNERQKHILGVARLLKQEGEKRKFSKNKIEELFVLGLLHDLGYEFIDEQDYSRHNQIGGEILKKQNYKYWKEVYYHGVPNSLYQSEFLDLLNWADMHINASGEYVDFEKRLLDISTRHKKPICELDSTIIVEELKKKEFNWTSKLNYQFWWIWANINIFKI